MTRHDVMRLLADARPDRLDPHPDGMPDPGTITAHPRPTTRDRTRNRTRRRLVLAGALPVAAALVAGTLVLTNNNGQTNNGQANGAQVNDPRTAGELMLVAAERTTTQSTTTDGRYQVIASEHGERKEFPGTTYAVMTRNAIERWRATDPADPSVEVHQYLGARPASPADEAAWRAAGAPDRWTEEPPAGMKAVEHTVAAGPRRVYPLRGGAERERLLLAGQPVTDAELAALPTDPAALRAQLLAKLRAAENTENENYALFYAGRSLLADLPVSAAVRAATYRMLADVPGIDLLGRVTDQGGRSGLAVAYTRRNDSGWGQIRLIVDPTTGTVLAQESWYLGVDRTGSTLRSWTLVLRNGYTDDDPPAA
jgi:hypothetical protein